MDESQLKRQRFLRRRLFLRVAQLTSAACAVYALAFAGRLVVRKYYLFLPNYIQWTFTRKPVVHGPTHLFFLYADHFEAETDDARSRGWVIEYAQMASRHRDSDGRFPQHTWFFPGEQPYDPHMLRLQKLVRDGFGEVELHLHHSYDTPDSLKRKLEAAVQYFQRFGFLRTVEGQTRFGFIHGMSALDNSNGPQACGVDTELQILREEGAFADFSFPSLWEASQPPYVNAIYDAVDDSGPRSYANGPPRAIGTGDLTIFTGPLVLVPSLNARRLFIDVEDGNIHPMIPATPARVDQWVRANVHVPQRPDWVFIKVFGHSASTDEDQRETLGPNFDRVLSYLEHRYNDGRSYILHYVTAREAYNLARAAAAGERGEPTEYFDYVIKPYVAGAAARRRPLDSEARRGPPALANGSATPQCLEKEGVSNLLDRCEGSR